MDSLRKLNNLDYSNYQGIYNYLETGIIPNSVANKDQHKFIQQYTDFQAHEGLIIYPPRELVVSLNEAPFKHELLTQLYNQYPSHGITQFYEIVRTYFLNITKKEATSFLKKQIPYQLTRELPKPKFKTKQYYHPNKAWSMDLIDMGSQADRRGYVWILTIMDLFNSKVWLRPLRRKLASAVQHELDLIFQTVQPKVIISDNGGEFSLKPFYAEHDVKWITTPSHTPLPHIERMNRQVRKFIREYQVRNKSLQWVDHLQDIENNINHYYLEVNPTKEVPIEERQNRNAIGITPKFAVNDHVRIKLSAIYAQVRAAEKANTSKTLPIKYSVYTYRIHKVYKSTNANGLASYSLKNDNDEIIVDSNEKALRYKQGDILKVDAHNEGEVINLRTAKRLNKL